MSLNVHPVLVILGGIGLSICLVRKLRPDLVVEELHTTERTGTALDPADVTLNMPVKQVTKVNDMEWLTVFIDGSYVTTYGADAPFEYVKHRGH